MSRSRSLETQIYSIDISILAHRLPIQNIIFYGICLLAYLPIKLLVNSIKFWQRLFLQATNRKYYFMHGIKIRGQKNATLGILTKAHYVECS